jgi:hypothetical protein
MILTKIYINNEQIDLKEDVSIPLNFNIADIREPEKRSTTWSKTVVLPGSTFNNELFSNIWNVNAVINSTGTTNFTPNFNPNLKAIAEITYNEATQFKGICQLLNVNVTDKYEIEYEVAFFGELQNVYQFFTNKYLRNIDLTEFNHPYTLNEQYLSWYRPIGEGYVYPMIDYGNSINSEFRVQHMYPAIYIKTIIDKMFSEAGFTYQSNFFNSDLFKRLIMPYNGKSDLKLNTTQVRDRSFRAEKTSVQTLSINKVFANSLPDGSQNANIIVNFQNDSTGANFDDGNHFYDINGGTNLNTFVVPRSGVYTFKTQLYCSASHYPSTATARVNASSLGMIKIVKNPLNQGSGYQSIANVPVYLTINYVSPQVENAFNIPAIASYNLSDFTISSGTTGPEVYGSLEITSFVNENDIIEIKFDRSYLPAPPTGHGAYNTISPSSRQLTSATSYVDVNINLNSYFTGFPADNNIQEYDEVDLNYNLPDNVKQSDFFNSIVKMFNLFVEVDKFNPNKLYIEPRPTFYSSGVTRDWSDKLDYSKETKIIPMGELNNKTYLFTYKEDTDFFNNQYKSKYGEIYGEKRYDIQNDFLKGEVKTELIFSPTPLVDTIGHDRVLSKIYTVDNNGQIKPTGSNMRILYYGGLKQTSYPWSHIATSGTTVRNDYPYAGHLDDVQEPTLDLNFGIPRQVYYTPSRYTSNNLYNKYWKDYIEQIADKDSKLFTGYFLINEFDIQSLDFRDTFFFENEYWRLNKIIDYDRINNQPTKCEFIKLKTLPTYIDDDGFDNKGGIEDNGNIIAPTGRITGGYNNNFYPEGAIVSGRNNVIQSGDGIIVTGNDNFIGIGSKNVSITSSSGVNVLGGVSNISVTNSSGITVTESNVTYQNGIKTLNNVSYKKYVALLSQSGVTAPTVVELETTMSSGITSSYYLVGEYKLLSNAEFTANKTFVMINQTGLSMVGTQAIILANRIGNSEILIQVADTMGTGYMDNVLLDTQIEIRVYS